MNDNQIKDVLVNKIINLLDQITPNNDNKNDFFQGVGFFEGMQNFKFSIWNRWGELIFDTTDPTVGWNGRKNNTGQLSPNGVYVCLVTYTGPRGDNFEIKGFATLIK